MIEMNLWESKFKNSYLFFKTTEEYFKYLTENDENISFSTRTSFTPGEEVEDILDTVSINCNAIFNYTNNEYPIAIAKHSFYPSYINPTFFEEHKEAFQKFTTDKIKKDIINKESYIIIPDYILNEELLDLIISNNKNATYVYKTTDIDTEINEELRKKIIDNHLEFNARYRKKENESISSKYLIKYNTYEDLTSGKDINLELPLKENEIANLRYVSANTNISFLRIFTQIDDEKEYIANLKDIFINMPDMDNQLNITIGIDNRNYLKKSSLLDIIPNNVNLFIKNDLYTYDLDTYKSEEEKIESLIKPIKGANLSPFETYLAVYDLVKNFKPYKENEENKSESRYLRYILKDDNEYIVCVGYSNLLRELLEHLDIPVKTIGVSVDTSYDNGFTMEEKTTELAGHERNLVKIDDDKYHIHGIYVVDSTWDNDQKREMYLNSLMTFNRKKEAKRLESLRDEDLLLDFNSFEDFQKKLNFFLKKEIRDSYNKKLKLEEKIIDAYEHAFDKIIKSLKSLDYDKYKYFYHKYNQDFYSYHKDLETFEPIAKEFLTEYAMYILPLSNKDVHLKTIIKAAAKEVKALKGLTDEETKEWIRKTIKENEEIESKAFPYTYHVDNKEAYVEAKKTRR